MNISIASGKGGTGKTTFAVNLAYYLGDKLRNKQQVTLLDCDVEEPNCHLFINSKETKKTPVTVLHPSFNHEMCDGCGKCVQKCNYNALALVKKKVLLFDELCHSCGLCKVVCPQRAIKEVPHEIGQVILDVGQDSIFNFGYGLLNIGEALAPKVVQALKKEIIQDGVNIIDSSPGTGCPVVESLSDADVTVLVTEPTPFGLHDLKLAVQLSLKMKKPTGIVINRSDGDDKIIAEFAEKVGLPILGRIPFARKYAESYSQGKILVQEFAELADIFDDIYANIIKLKESEVPKFKESDFILSGNKKEEVVFSEYGNSKDFKEIIVISGKGGTGKTTITSSLAELAESKVMFDTDVDAADLQLLLKPSEYQENIFISGKIARIDSNKCIACGLCKECHFDAIKMSGPKNNIVQKTYEVDESHCEGCGFCEFICPVGAISLSPEPTGKCFISKTNNFPMSHAELGVGAENSGKLVTQVRNKAAELATKLKHSHSIGDGPPGTGCPVIASVTGVDLVIIVTEPTVSGLHDMERVIKLTRHFGVKTSVIINKCDLNKDMSNRIHKVAESANIAVIAEIPFDRNIHDALMKEQTIIEYGKGEAYEIIKNLWNKIDENL